LIKLGAVPSGLNLTFESALDWSWPPPSESLVGNNGAIRTIKRWVVLPIADFAWRLKVWRWHIPSVGSV
jgi:hypothetical protein